MLNGSFSMDLYALFAAITAKGVGALLLAALVIYGVVAMVRRPKPTAISEPGSVADQQWRLPFRPLQVVAIVLAIFLLTQFLAGLVLTLVLSATGFSSEKIDALLANSAGWQLVYMLLVDGTVVATIYWLLKRRGFSMRAIGLVKPQLADAGYAIVAYVVYFGALLVVLGLVGQLLPNVNWNQKQELGFDTSATGVGLLPIFISLVILPPFAEEIMMRGLLYTGLRSTLPLAVAAVLTSLLFGAAHLFNGGALLWAAAIDTFMLSLVLVWLRQTRRSLWPCIALHAIKNGMAFIYLFVFKVV